MPCRLRCAATIPRATTWMESGGLTAEWPVYYPSESFSLLFRGPANTQLILPDDYAMGQSLLEDGAGIFNYSLMARAIDEMTRYGWMNTNYTDEERLAAAFFERMDQPAAGASARSAPFRWSP